MQTKTVVVNSYLGALLITIIAGGATLMITRFANSVAFADYTVVDPEMVHLLEE